MGEIMQKKQFFKMLGYGIFITVGFLVCSDLRSELGPQEPSENIGVNYVFFAFMFSFIAILLALILNSEKKKKIGGTQCESTEVML